MAKLSKEDIKKLASLARIALSDQEIEQFQVELSSILRYVEQLQSIDTKGVEPTSQVTGLVNVMRPDEERDYGATHEELLKNAPELHKGYIKVRKIL